MWEFGFTPEILGDGEGEGTSADAAHSVQGWPLLFPQTQHGFNHEGQFFPPRELEVELCSYTSEAFAVLDFHSFLSS